MVPWSTSSCSVLKLNTTRALLCSIFDDLQDNASNLVAAIKNKTKMVLFVLASEHLSQVLTTIIYKSINLKLWEHDHSSDPIYCILVSMPSWWLPKIYLA